MMAALEDKQWSSKDVGKKELIGEGGFSKVFSALVKGQKGLKVVLKVTSEDILSYLNRSSGNGSICAFQEEYETHRALSHENVVKVLGFYKVKTDSVMVMEFCARGDLQKYLAGESAAPYSKERSHKYARDIGNGLAYIHNVMKTLHMDLKLENILVTDSDVAKITDFGFAIKTTYLRKLHFKSRGGTRWYRPPEQLTSGQFDSTADIWAFGCICYELMIKHHPFFNTNLAARESYNSKDEEPGAIVRMITRDKYLYINRFTEESSEFQLFISRVFEYSRLRRPVAPELLSLPWISE